MKKTSHPNEKSNSKKRDSELESLLHSEHTVVIEKMAIGGDGVARIPFKDKSIVVFVNRSAPEDHVLIQITQVEKSFLKAKVIKVLRASPFRRNAPCVYFDKCGGCSWQHIVEDEQIRQKENLLKELLKKFTPDLTYQLEQTITSKNVFNYRNRIQLKHLNSSLGYFQNETHDIVDIDTCLIADLKISSEIKKLKQSLKPTIELKKYELRINQNNEFESYRIGEKGEGLSFSQVNNSVNTQLIELVSEAVIQINPSFITELYAGSGNFTFELLKKLTQLKVESVELNPELTSYATKHLTALNLQKRLFAFTTDCESFVQRRSLSEELVLLDPPRAGVSDIVLKKIKSTRPKNIIYISCHPVSLARDLQKMNASDSKYKIQKLVILDMFPQTDHFETFVHLILIDSSTGDATL